MARNKYPQETVDKILNTAMGLFMEKGYEHTSIQDIIDHLGGLTKWAIYYHFKSKEDILLAIANRMGEAQETWMEGVLHAPGLTGLEKLRNMFILSLNNRRQQEMLAAGPDLPENAHMLTILLQGLIRDVAPHYICPLMEEGVRDGSITTSHPNELGQILILPSDFWFNPLVWPAEPGEIRSRATYYFSMLRTLGVDLMNEELSAVLEKYYALRNSMRR